MIVVVKFDCLVFPVLKFASKVPGVFGARTTGFLPLAFYWGPHSLSIVRYSCTMYAMHILK